MWPLNQRCYWTRFRPSFLNTGFPYDTNGKQTANAGKMTTVGAQKLPKSPDQSWSSLNLNINRWQLRPCHSQRTWLLVGSQNGMLWIAGWVFSWIFSVRRNLIHERISANGSSARFMGKCPWHRGKKRCSLFEFRGPRRVWHLISLYGVISFYSRWSINSSLIGINKVKTSRTGRLSSLLPFWYFTIFNIHFRTKMCHQIDEMKSV